MNSFDIYLIGSNYYRIEWNEGMPSETRVDISRFWELPSVRALKSDRQRKFVVEYTVDNNARQAAIRAGYRSGAAAQQGCRLLTKEHVRAAVDDCQARVAAGIELSAEGVLERLQDLTEEARDEKQYGAAIRGLDLLGRHLGLWRTGRESTRPEPVDAEYTDEPSEQRSDREILLEFAEDVRMLAEQNDCWAGVSVQEFHARLIQMCDGTTAA
jgi:phage terminase small subunit